MGREVAAMTCLVFVLLKAFQVFACPYDWPIALVLLGLDLIVVAEYRRLWLHARGR